MKIRWTLGRKLFGLAALGAFGTVIVAGVGEIGLRSARRGVDALMVTTRAQRLQMDADMMHDALRADVLATVLGTATRDTALVRDGQDSFKEHTTRFRKSIADARALTTGSTLTLIDSLKAPVDSYVAAGETVIAAALAHDTSVVARKQSTFLEQFLVLEAGMEKFGDSIAADAKSTDSKNDALFTWLTRALFAVTLITAAIVFRVGQQVGRRIQTATVAIVAAVEHLQINAVSALGDAMTRLAAGDVQNEVVATALPVQVTGHDELTTLATTVNSIGQHTIATVEAHHQAMRTLRALLEETARSVATAQRGDLSARAAEENFPGAFGQLLHGFNEAQSAMRLPVEAALAVLEQAADRNLSERVVGDFQGDYARLAEAVNLAIGNLATALQEFEVSAEQIAGASHEVADGSQALANSASAQATAVEEITAAVQEQASVTTRTAGNADEARTLTLHVRDRVRSGSATMRELDTSMNRMAESAKKTAQIVKRIDEIAFQTNLLALNAAVEAARAGDAGRGFAVVADEVRQLAIRAAEAAQETSALIDETVLSTRQSTALSRQVGEHLGTVETDVDRVTTVVGEIANDCTLQRDQIAEVSRAVEQVSLLTQRAAASAEESASASEELNAQAAAMRDLVQQFQVDDDSGAPRKTARRSSGALPGKPKESKRSPNSRLAILPT